MDGNKRTEPQEGRFVTPANAAERLPTPDELGHYLAYVLRAQTRFPKPERLLAGNGDALPNLLHPLDCFTEISAEGRLSEADRAVGGLVLLFHGVREDSTAVLLEDLSRRVKRLIRALALVGREGHDPPAPNDPAGEPFLRLLALYDRCSHWKFGDGTLEEGRARSRQLIGRLSAEAAITYGADLNIIKIARALTCD